MAFLWGEGHCGHSYLRFPWGGERILSSSWVREAAGRCVWGLESVCCGVRGLSSAGCSQPQSLPLGHGLSCSVADPTQKLSSLSDQICLLPAAHGPSEGLW